MPYYNGFPATYQPIYQTPQYQAPQYQTPQQSYQAPQAQQPSGGVSIVQIQGEASAKSYLVAPNSTVQLWDMDSGVIYIKSADASGMPSMKILDFTVRGEAPSAPAAPAVEYATKSEVNVLADKIRDLQDEFAHADPEDQRQQPGQGALAQFSRHHSRSHRQALHRRWRRDSPGTSRRRS